MIEGTLHGRVTFEWIEGGAFIKQVSEVDAPQVPTGVSIFGSDDDSETFYMLYFDERGVSRRYEMTMEGNVWKWWRNVSKFSQRYSGTFSDDGNTIVGKGELSEDDATWKPDLQLTYTRVK